MLGLLILTIPFFYTIWLIHEYQDNHQHETPTISYTIENIDSNFTIIFDYVSPIHFPYSSAFDLIIFNQSMDINVIRNITSFVITWDNSTEESPNCQCYSDDGNRRLNSYLKDQSRIQLVKDGFDLFNNNSLIVTFLDNDKNCELTSGDKIFFNNALKEIQETISFSIFIKYKPTDDYIEIHEVDNQKFEVIYNY